MIRQCAIDQSEVCKRQGNQCAVLQRNGGDFSNLPENLQETMGCCLQSLAEFRMVSDPSDPHWILPEVALGAGSHYNMMQAAAAPDGDMQGKGSVYANEHVHGYEML